MTTRAQGASRLENSHARHSRSSVLRDGAAGGGTTEERPRGRRDHEAAAGGRSPFRSPDPALEPEDAAFHLRRAQRDLHRRPAPDPRPHRHRVPVRPRAPSPTAAPCCSSARRSRRRSRSSTRPSAAACRTSTSAGSAACSPTSRPCTRASPSCASCSARCDSGEIDQMPKKEGLKVRRDLAKLERNLGGIKNLEKLPERGVRDRHEEGAHRGHRGEPPAASRWSRSSTPTATPTSSTT